MKLKKKGSVEYFDLAELTGKSAFDGVRVGIKYVGSAKAKSWGLQIQGVQQREMMRVIELRKGRSPNEAPELYAKDENGNSAFSTEDGLRESLELTLSVLTDCIACIEGVEGFEKEKDPAKLVELIDEIGVAALLFEPALKAQQLSQEQSFLSESSPASSPAISQS
jgi:hypothetical protein